MNRKYRMPIFTLIFICVIAALAFAQAAQGGKAPAGVPAIYVGMPKNDLYKVYSPKYQLKNYVKDGIEVIVFDDYITPQIGDTINFYLQDGKVKWWDKVQTPQEKKAADNVKIYAGMSRKEVYDAYPIKYQLQDYLKGSMEMMIFDDYLTAEIGDTITFYLKDGKVTWWDKVQANATPEERLKAILNRSAHAQDNLSEGGASDSQGVPWIKRSDRADTIGASGVRRHLKGVQ